VVEDKFWHKDKVIGWTNKELLPDFWQEQLSDSLWAHTDPIILGVRRLRSGTSC